jgi:hypothetical protein
MIGKELAYEWLAGISQYLRKLHRENVRNQKQISLQYVKIPFKIDAAKDRFF